MTDRFEVFMDTLRRTRTATFLMTAIASVMVVAQQANTDWTQWRGPTRDGAATTFRAPATWPDALVQKWKVEVGQGYASPIVVGNRVYVFSRRGTNEGMSAHDAATGRELWRFGYEASFTMNSASARHNAGPKSTPVFANGRLLSIGMTGVLTAWDAATGRTIWQKPGSEPVPMYTTHASSPIVDGTIAIVHLGGHDKGSLTALDVVSGETRWSWPGDGPSYGSPIIAAIGGTKQVITITQTKVVGVELATGALLWERPFVHPNVGNSNTPLLYGQTIIVGGNLGPTVAFTAEKSGAEWTTTTAWENPDVPLRLTNLVLMGDMLFGITNRNGGQYFALDAKTGKTLWTSPARQAGTGAIAKTGDYLLSLEDDGELVVVKNTTTAFEVVKKYKVADTDTWTEAVFSGDRIFVRDVNHLTLWTVS
jgi:outer membrane protein assembly factor BamB